MHVFQVEIVRIINIHNVYMGVVLVLSLIVLGLLVILFILCYAKMTMDKRSTCSLLGGGRNAIFSRFNYIPAVDFMSKFDVIDVDKYSKLYSDVDKTVKISDRYYDRYTMLDGNWSDTWYFPTNL
jgi:hypothetical protein